MQLTAVRGTEDRDRVYVTRDDDTEVFWTWPSYGRDLPHDLVHWVVESEVHLDQGFWGLVASGVDPTRVNKSAERIASGVRLRDLAGLDLTQLIQAEHLSVLVSRATWSSIDDAITYVNDQCESFGVDRPEGLDPRSAERMVQRCAELNRNWQAVAPDAGLVLAWPPSATDP
jgi:hypothetical protein